MLLLSSAPYRETWLWWLVGGQHLHATQMSHRRWKYLCTGNTTRPTSLYSIAGASAHLFALFHTIWILVLNSHPCFEISHAFLCLFIYTSTPFLLTLSPKCLHHVQYSGLYPVSPTTSTKSPVPHVHKSANTAKAQPAHTAQLMSIWRRADPLNVNLQDRVILLQGVLNISKTVLLHSMYFPQIYERRIITLDSGGS